jgi:glycosyltransferase involved in cell wall biosynthesis
VPERLAVSAIIPLYNGRHYLRSAVESVTHQTEPPDELIIIDDGSTDGGTDVLDGLQAPFPIRVVHQDNAGQSAARNAGVRSSTGDLIAFLDQDDLWHPRHLALLCPPLLEDPAVGWSYSDFDEIDSDGRTVTLSFLREHQVDHPKRTLVACLANDLMVLPSASVVRRQTFDALVGFDETLQGYEDDDLYIRAFRSGWRLAFVDQSLTCFRVHDFSSSATGRFLESRLRFSAKLTQGVLDDRRLNRYYGRDVVAPRFFRSSLDDYVRAVSEEDWEYAERAFAALTHFASMTRDRSTLRWKLAVIRDPRRFRRILRAHDALPSPLRLTRNPTLRLR